MFDSFPLVFQSIIHRLLVTKEIVSELEFINDSFGTDLIDILCSKHCLKQTKDNCAGLQLVEKP